MFSDGQAMPDFRVKEAWCDGLDAIAITDHLEFRPNEGTFFAYLKPYFPEGEEMKAKNNKISETPPDEDGILGDLNFTYKRRALKESPNYGITVIRGTEISRNGTTVGHYNALFTSNNNKIYDPDPIVSMRKAKKQGALIIHNHPGWRKSNIDYTETDKIAYDEGLIDGVEVMNHSEFYPGIIDRALERGICMMAASDIHSSTAAEFYIAGTHRPMTLVLANENTGESLREALIGRRTIAYANNTLCGEEQLLKDLFTSSMTLKVIREEDNKGKVVLGLTNNSSIPYLVAVKGGNPDYLGPFCTLMIKQKAGTESVAFEIMNMYCSKKTHPIIEMNIR
jgi:predicted metal-dependent phosphoesterase TrpH